jgi:hypothetical protein
MPVPAGQEGEVLLAAGRFLVIYTGKKMREQGEVTAGSQPGAVNWRRWR